MRFKALLSIVAVAAVLPVAALADTVASADKANGARACQALKTSVGPATFDLTYATFGKCVSAWTRREHQNRHEADTACKAEQADAGFAAAHDGKSFAQFYGLGKHGANAIQRCVQSKRQAESAADRRATVNAARQCKAERKSMGAAAFSTRYGGKANAFGKCVSKLAQAQQG